MRGVSRLNTFVAPRPNRPVMRLMTDVNRVAMLGGVPGLRSLWPFSRVPGLRGLADVRRIDWPQADRDRLVACCGPGRATFIAPNHPEFFTDWMIDKELLSRSAPLAACWATHSVVNGLGPLAQKFWLANNLIAQIPGNGAAGRAHSVAWALQGHGVLLHPEGAVGWHGDYVAPLLPGAVEMAREALERGRAAAPSFEAWVVPVVWKLVFLRDAEAGLIAECAYVERRLEMTSPVAGMPLPERVYRIYDELLSRDEKAIGIASSRKIGFAARHGIVVDALAAELRRAIGSEEADGDLLLRQARRAVRERSLPDEAGRHARKTADRLALARRIGAYAFAAPTMTQENIAEHLKRIRNDHCKGTLRDTMSSFVPRPVAPRVAHVRVAEPIALHRWEGSTGEAVAELRRRLQTALDRANAEPQLAAAVRRYDNPFHAPAKLGGDA